MYRDNHWGTHRRGVHRDSVHRDGAIWICHQVQLTCAHTHTPITTAGLVRLSISTHPLVVIHQASIFTTECADGVHFPANRGDRPPPPPPPPPSQGFCHYMYVCCILLQALRESFENSTSILKGQLDSDAYNSTQDRMRMEQSRLQLISST